jgi:hypothetical protein
MWQLDFRYLRLLLIGGAIGCSLSYWHERFECSAESKLHPSHGGKGRNGIATPAIAVGLILSFLVIDVLTRKAIRGSSD